MKILFLTRSFSKTKGGKEIYNYNFYNSLNKRGVLEKISCSGSILNLAWFYPYAFFRALFIKDLDQIHLGDNFMLPLAILLKKIKKVPISLTTYGLELTYKNKFYRKLFVKPLRNVDKFIAISSATKEETIKQGISKKKVFLITPGINPSEFKTNKIKNEMISEIESKYKLNLTNKKILLTSGRLVKRKGVGWFIRNVFEKLGKDYIYLVSGEGEERTNILKAIKDTKQEKRVFLLGRTSFDDLKILYHISDIFIMPNIKVKGDMEGFGIVLIEAGTCGLPVVASKIEGIKDAVIDGKTGYLVEEKEIGAFLMAIEKAEKLSPSNIHKEVERRFSWDNVAKDYLEAIK